MVLTLYRVVYTSGITRIRTSPYMPFEDCKREVKRFNNLPLLDIERLAMDASIEDEEIEY